MSDTFAMRAPCKHGCQTSEGVIRTKNGQDCVYCAECDGHQYNAPKTETGREVRSSQTVHKAIRPKQRARILGRANGHCELCGKRGSPLVVAHLLSVEHGLAQGLTNAEINCDENLAAWCDECNLGLGQEPVPLRLVIALAIGRIRQTQGGTS